MSEAVVDDIVAVLPPLLQSLEALGFIARYLNPPDFDRVMGSVGQPDEALRAVRPRLELLDCINSHQRRAVEPDEEFRIELVLHVIERAPQYVVSLFGVQDQVIACRLNP